MRVILIGPPGAGKGTQARLVSQRLAIPAISTGDIFRANVSAGTALGKRAHEYMAAGDYVPDDLTNRMVRARLAEPDATGGFLLDGYPRTLAQVSELDQLFAASGASVDAVLCLTVDPEKLIQRLLRRALIEQRPDDTEDVIRHRQRVYAEQTEPLVEVYRRRGIARFTSGEGDVACVTARILDVLVGASPSADH